MFNDGKTIVEIAKDRSLVPSTIEVHLSFFVEKGELDIDRLLSAEKQQAMVEQLAADHSGALSEIKKGLGDDYSFTGP